MKLSLEDQDLVYVASNLVIEPLVDSWYAWTHLISPATAALNIKKRHLKIMESYVQNPNIHAAAVKSPKMLGGPFIDYNGQRVEEVEELMLHTKSQHADLLQLCEEVEELNYLLANEAKGYTLSDLYPKIPLNLRGLIELYYDLNENPSFRFIEALLYNTKYYKEDLQSIRMFRIENDDSRSFVLSTPSLPGDAAIHLPIPFRSKTIDSFFRCCEEALPFGELKKMFPIPAAQEDLFKTFLQREKSGRYQAYTGSGALTRYFGHACILVETQEMNVLVDPVISYGYDTDISRYTYSDLPEVIDFVLITHNHQDHVLFETLLRIRHKVRQIIVPRSGGGSLQDPNLKLVLERIGFEQVIELGEMESIRSGGCTLSGIPFFGEHSDLDIRTKLCYLVDFNTQFKMIFAADSCNVEPAVYQRVHEIYGDVDVMFLGMECEGAPLSWLYGPLLMRPIEHEKDQSRRLAGCNFDQSSAFIDAFNPKSVFVYAMGMEPWLKYISSIKYTEESKAIIESNRLLAYCRDKGIDAERLFGEKVLEYNYQGQVHTV